MDDAPADGQSSVAAGPPFERMLTLRVNGRTGEHNIPSHMTLAEFLRDRLGLMGCENDITQAFFDKCVKHAFVTGRLWQPHRFRVASEAITKVSQSPANLCAEIAFVAERQNRVTVGLRNRVAVPGLRDDALAIGGDDPVVSTAVMLVEPAQQRRTEIETDVFVIVESARFAVWKRHNYGAVRAITFGMDAFVPIVKWRGGRLFFNYSRPRIFAWGLVEMSVNDERGHRA